MLCMMFGACTEVDLCYYDEHPHTAEVDIVYNWQNAPQPADSMVVMAYRVANEWTCGYMTTSDGGSGHYLFNQLDTVKVATDGSAPLWTKCGELRFLTYSYSPTGVFVYSKLDDQTAILKNNVYVTYKEYALNSAINSGLSEGWNELNTYAKYVPHAPEENVYYEYTSPQNIVPGVVNTVDFTPKGILQNIDFNFDITAADVTIDKIVAEFAGVTKVFNLTRGKTGGSATCKTLFPVEKSAKGYTGKIYVTGLDTNGKASGYSGVGILQLAIHATSNGNTVVHNLQMNMYNKLQEYAVMNKVRQEHVVLDIAAPIVVTSSGVELPAVETGLDKWKKSK